MADIIIDNDKCDNCGDCADVCPMEVLILEDEKLTVNEPDECSYCESCVEKLNMLYHEDSLTKLYNRLNIKLYLQM